MRLSYDETVNALYIQLSDGLSCRTEEFDTGTLVDVDEHGRILGIEVLRPAREWPLAQILARFDVDDDTMQILVDLWSQPDSPYPFAEAGQLSA